MYCWEVCKVRNGKVLKEQLVCAARRKDCLFRHCESESRLKGNGKSDK